MDATEKQAGGGGVTFAVEPGIKAAGPGSYGADWRVYREPSTGDSMAAAWGKLGQVEGLMGRWEARITELNAGLRWWSNGAGSKRSWQWPS